jgi:hypothetical protein
MKMKKIGVIFTVSLLLLLSFALAETASLQGENINPEELTKEQITQLINDNLDKVNLSEMGGFLNWMLDDSTVNVNFTKNNEEIHYGFIIKEKEIQGFKEGLYEDYDYEISFNFEELLPAFESENPASELKQAYNSGKIVLKANSFKAKIVKFLAGILLSFLPDNFNTPDNPDNSSENEFNNSQEGTNFSE